MKALFFAASLAGTILSFDLGAALASEEDKQALGTTKRHLDLSLPPLHPDGEYLAAPPKAATPSREAPAAKKVQDEVPPPDPKSLDDDIDDTRTEQAIEPHVEEDSAGALDDMGDVGGDFEE